MHKKPPAAECESCPLCELAAKSPHLKNTTMFSSMHFPKRITQSLGRLQSHQQHFPLFQSSSYHCTKNSPTAGVINHESNHAAVKISGIGSTRPCIHRTKTTLTTGNISSPNTIQSHRNANFSLSMLPYLSYSLQKSSPRAAAHFQTHLSTIQKRNFQSRDFPSRAPKGKIFLYHAHDDIPPQQLEALEREIPPDRPIYVLVSQFPMGKDSKDIATEVFNKHWKLPSDGVLIFMSLLDRRLEIITGVDVEVPLRPSYLSAMQHRFMLSEFRAGRLYEGIRNGIIQVEKRLSWWDQLDEEERAEEATKKQFHYIDSRPGVEHEKEAEETIKNLGMDQSGTKQVESGQQQQQSSSSGGEKDSSSGGSFFDLHLSTSSHSIGKHKEVESDSRMTGALVAFFLATVAAFGFAIQRMSRPACPECQSKKTKMTTDCKKLLPQYREYLEEQIKQRELAGENVEEEGLKLDHHGSEMLHFDQTQMRDALRACMQKLVPENWHEMELNSMNYHIRRCNSCHNEFAASSRKMFSKYYDCPSCSFRGYKEFNRITERMPDYTHNGITVVNFKCQICTYETSKREFIPRLTRSSGGSGFSSSGGSSSGSSGGGSSGGGAGSSW